MEKYSTSARILIGIGGLIPPFGAGVMYGERETYTAAVWWLGIIISVVVVAVCL